MYTSPAIHVSSALQMQAALAEAWHVDGCFAEAVAGWEALASAGSDRAESTLKAAISCFSSARHEKGLHWLHCAEEAGASIEETLYVRAQFFWRQGRVERAIETFQQAERAASHLGKASNALGVLYWQLEWIDKARQHFARALQHDPSDGEALVNAASLCLRTDVHPVRDHLCTLPETRDLLERAAALQPQRAEAFVWYSRLLRRIHAEEEAREALGKARLRGRFRGEISFGQQDAHPAVGGRVQVRGRFSVKQVLLTLLYTYADSATLPTYLAVNSGYELVVADGVALKPVAEKEVRQCFELPRAANIVFYRVPRRAWRRVVGSASLEVAVVGRPIPPCVTLGEAEIELDGQSGWLPLLLPLVPLNWQIGVRFPRDLTLFLSSDEPEEQAPGLIALRDPKVVSLEQSAASGCITGIARGDSPLLHLASLLVRRTLTLWEERVGTLRRAYPDVIIVDQPTSLFCYARRKYLRLPSGLARQFAHSAQICHEVGHLWWGLDVRFAPADAWLGEALAEYSLHLAEEAGWLTGYRQNALTLLRSLQDGALPAQSLMGLHRSAGKYAAYSLRVKGGYLIAMLRTLMGEQAFWNFLRTVHDLGAEQRFDAYRFFALASRWHESSLNWFANQWVYAETSMAFSIEDYQLTHLEELFSLSFDVRSRGLATPGGPVTVAIQSEGGEERRIPVDLNLGRAAVSVTLPARPERIIIDPDLCWYAEQGEMIISGGNR